MPVLMPLKEEIFPEPFKKGNPNPELLLVQVYVVFSILELKLIAWVLKLLHIA